MFPIQRLGVGIAASSLTRLGELWLASRSAPRTSLFVACMEQIEETWDGELNLQDLKQK